MHYFVYHILIVTFFTYSLESPFRKILNNALKHEQKVYECPILSTDCPFKNKQFIKRIKLGQEEPKEFMDEMMQDVLSDLNKPLATGYKTGSNNHEK